ncbi:hypothetical protein ACH0CP_13540 [Sphingomonas sp. 179-I 2A4 NHS]|uniref:hypothetical protein n=1 Tax=unclassified Sphingomonas TaxID=196159 RepID=UPI003879D20E
MAFVIFEPAVLAVMTVGVAPSAPAAPILAPVVSASPCASHPTTTRAFECCIDLARWKVPPTAPLNHPAQPADGAADQKEGR